MDSRSHFAPAVLPSAVERFTSPMYLAKASKSPSDKRKALPKVPIAPDSIKVPSPKLVCSPQRASSIYSRNASRCSLDRKPEEQSELQEQTISESAPIVNDQTGLDHASKMTAQQESWPSRSSLHERERVPSFGTFVRRIPDAPGQRSRPVYPRIIIPQSQSRDFITTHRLHPSTAPVNAPSGIAPIYCSRLGAQTAPPTESPAISRAAHDHQQPLHEQGLQLKRSQICPKYANLPFLEGRKRSTRQKVDIGTATTSTDEHKYLNHTRYHSACFTSTSLTRSPSRNRLASTTLRQAKSMAQLSLRTQIISRHGIASSIPRPNEEAGRDAISSLVPDTCRAWSDGHTCTANHLSKSTDRLPQIDGECSVVEDEDEDNRASMSGLSGLPSWRQWMSEETADTGGDYAHHSPQNTMTMPLMLPKVSGTAAGTQAQLDLKKSSKRSSCRKDTRSQTSDGLPSSPLTIYRISQTSETLERQGSTHVQALSGHQTSPTSSVKPEAGACSGLGRADSSTLGRMQSIRYAFSVDDTSSGPARFSWEPAAAQSKSQAHLSTLRNPSSPRQKHSTGDSVLHQPTPTSALRFSCLDDQDLESLANPTARAVGTVSSLAILIDSPERSDSDGSAEPDDFNASSSESLSTTESGLVPAPLSTTKTRTQAYNYWSQRVSEFHKHEAKTDEPPTRSESTASTVRPLKIRPPQASTPAVPNINSPTMALSSGNTVASYSHDIRGQPCSRPREVKPSVLTNVPAWPGKLSDRARASVSSNESLASTPPSLFYQSDDSSPNTSFSDNSSASNSGPRRFLSPRELEDDDVSDLLASPRVHEAWQKRASLKSWYSVDILPIDASRKPWEKSRCTVPEESRGHTRSLRSLLHGDHGESETEQPPVLGIVRVVPQAAKTSQRINTQCSTPQQLMVNALYKVRQIGPLYNACQERINFDAIVSVMRAARDAATNKDIKKKPHHSAKGSGRLDYATGQRQGQKENTLAQKRSPSSHQHEAKTASGTAQPTKSLPAHVAWSLAMASSTPRRSTEAFRNLRSREAFASAGTTVVSKALSPQPPPHLLLSQKRSAAQISHVAVARTVGAGPCPIPLEVKVHRFNMGSAPPSPAPTSPLPPLPKETARLPATNIPAPATSTVTRAKTRIAGESIKIPKATIETSAIVHRPAISPVTPTTKVCVAEKYRVGIKGKGKERMVSPLQRTEYRVAPHQEGANEKALPAMKTASPNWQESILQPHQQMKARLRQTTAAAPRVHDSMAEPQDDQALPLLPPPPPLKGKETSLLVQRSSPKPISPLHAGATRVGGNGRGTPQKRAEFYQMALSAYAV